MSTAKLCQLLLENSTRRFHVEYNTFIYNHISQGIVALHRLGASDERIEQFINWYVPRLEYAENHHNIDDGVIKNSSTKRVSYLPKTHPALQGTPRSYYPLLTAYDKLLREECNDSIERLLCETFPALSNGMLGGAMHGAIQIGCGIQANVPWLVCEGLAYSHYAYLPLNLTGDDKNEFERIGLGNKDFLHVLDLISKDDDLKQFLLKQPSLEGWDRKTEGGFTCLGRPLFTQKASEIISYANMIQFPEFYDPEQLDNEQIVKLFTWMCKSAIYLYALSVKRNAFFLLHGVTSSWALLNTIPLLKELIVPLQHSLNILRTFICTVIAVYLIQGTPQLGSVQKLKEELSARKNSSWKELVTETLAEDRDEHIFKLVQVCWDMDKMNPADDEWIYRSAASIALDYRFHFEQIID